MFYGQTCKDLAPADARRLCICFNQCGLVLVDYFFEILMVLKAVFLYYSGQCDCTASQKGQLTCKFKGHSFWTVRTSGSEKSEFCVLFLKCHCSSMSVFTTHWPRNVVWLGLQTAGFYREQKSLYLLWSREWIFLWDAHGSWDGTYRPSTATSMFGFSSHRGKLTSRVKLNVCSVY